MTCLLWATRPWEGVLGQQEGVVSLLAPILQVVLSISCWRHRVCRGGSCAWPHHAELAGLYCGGGLSQLGVRGWARLTVGGDTVVGAEYRECGSGHGGSEQPVEEDLFSV